MPNKFTPHFEATDSMADLVRADYNILPLLSRFSIPLGFGNDTIGEICSKNDIDADTFLLIANFTLSNGIDHSIVTPVAALGIVDFLHNSHDYFISYKFPHIRSNLLNALDANHSDINPAIIAYFDDYVNQVKLHFEYEETTVFPYIRRLLSGEKSDYKIDIFRKNHDEIGEKLSDLKNVILKYYTTSKPNLMYDVLVDIFNCEDDLDQHNDIENDILVPLIESFEKSDKK
ncbi:MAG: hemerythrin domain-containing protein [Muribaculaceae bacterium]|nr:hemerythrin domain-containing protein [Muribaculaceae bacterium]